MGLFHFGKKEPKKQPEQPGLPPEEAARRWKDAYRANPQVYQKQDALLGSCTLTEGVDTLLPLQPERQWAVNGKRVLGQIEYQEAMTRLRPFSLAVSEGWILIRAMTHAELDGLFEGLPRQLA